MSERDVSGADRRVRSGGLAACVAIGFAMLSLPAHADKRGRVVEYGIYSADHKLQKKTSDIPVGRDLRFGFCFEVKVDIGEDKYMLSETLKHPPVAGPGGIEETGYSIPRMFKVENGVARGCSGYRSREASDLKPGVWKFTISDGDEDVVVQEFSVK